MNKNVLISGGGIAGLTLAILLKEKGWEPTIVERDPAMRTEGYVIDFAGAGWDVAERIGVIDELRKVKYPIAATRYLNAEGKPYVSLSMDSIRKALNGKYAYLQRSDLERVLFEKAKALGVVIRFGTTIGSLNDDGKEVAATFDDGTEERYALVFGADGIHSRVRGLVFGPESQFDRYLGYYVAAFHLKNHEGTGTSDIYEEADRTLWVYSLNEKRMSVMYMFRHENIGYVPPEERLQFLKKAYRGSGWIAEKLLAEVESTDPLFFDTATQIVMPSWSKGRVALLGDACACLTLLAGQGSHMAMAEAYVLATELDRHAGDHAAAFAAYEKMLKAVTVKKQKDAVGISKFFVASKRTFMPFRRLVERILFSDVLIGFFLRSFGVKSVLAGYPSKK